MGRRSVRPRRADHARDCASELEGLLVPEAVFADPFEVVSDESLSRDENAPSWRVGSHGSARTKPPHD